MTLHYLLDWNYGSDGDDILRSMLEDGADPNQTDGEAAETSLHVATRRRRLSAVEILLDHGAEIDARTAGAKTAYAHAVRRSFTEVAEFLAQRGADTALNAADQFAIAVGTGRLDDAREILNREPGVIHTGNPEEDRLLADIAGRNDSAAVKFLIEAGANVAAPGLDDGTPLHIAAWFGQPDNVQLLIDAGAPLDLYDSVHESTPIHWGAHGSRYSGGVEERQAEYVALVKILLDAGSSLTYPHEVDGESYIERLLCDASPEVRSVIEARPRQ